MYLRQKTISVAILQACLLMLALLVHCATARASDSQADSGDATHTNAGAHSTAGTLSNSGTHSKSKIRPNPAPTSDPPSLSSPADSAAKGDLDLSSDQIKAQALVDKGAQLIQLHQYKEARLILLKCVRLAPDYAEAHHNLGLALAGSGSVASGIAELERAIRLKPDMAASYITLGALQQGIGDIDGALEHYLQFLQRFPTHAYSRNIEQLRDFLLREKSESESATVDGAGAKDGESPTLNSSVVHAPIWSLKSMPLKVRIGGSLRASVPSGFSCTGVGPPAPDPLSFEQIMAKALSSWAQVSNGALSFRILPSEWERPRRPFEDADIECHLVQPSALQSITEAGETVLEKSSDAKSKVIIKIAKKPLSPVTPMTKDQLLQVCLHEIGHALGIRQHSKDPRDVMFYTTRFGSRVRKPTSNDIQMLRHALADQCSLVI